MSSAPKIKLSELMSGRLDAKTIAKFLRPAYREADALDLLSESLELLEQAAKRLPRLDAAARCQKVERALRSSDPLVGFTKALAIYALELEPKRRGRKPSTKVVSRALVGRPRSWTPTIYAGLLHEYNKGKAILLSKNVRVTASDALFQAFRADDSLSSERALKADARRYAKRLPDARRAVRKIPIK